MPIQLLMKNNLLLYSILYFLFTFPVHAYYMPNPHCSPELMAAMLASRQPLPSAKEEKKQIEKRIKEEEKKKEELLNKIRDEASAVLDNENGDEILLQIIDYRKDENLQKDDYTKELCGQLRDGSSPDLRCRNDNTECTVWTKWMNCAKDNRGKVNFAKLCSKPQECLFEGYYKDALTDPPIRECSPTPICTANIYANKDKHTCHTTSSTNTYTVDVPEMQPHRVRSSRRRGNSGINIPRNERECEKWIKDRELDDVNIARIKENLRLLEEDKQALEDDPEKYLTEASTNCINCRTKAIAKLLKPSPWQRVGQALSAAAGVGLGLYAIRDSNRMRDRQGFAAQPGLGLSLAYPFIMNGIHGGGLFGNSLACSPTIAGGMGSVFGGGFGGGFPGGFGGGFPGGFQGGFGGGFPGGFGGGFPGGFQGGFGGGFPGGFQGGFPGGFQGGFGGGFPGGFQGGFPGGFGGGFPGGFQGGFPGGFGGGFPGGFGGDSQADFKADLVADSQVDPRADSQVCKGEWGKCKPIWITKDQ